MSISNLGAYAHPPKGAKGKSKLNIGHAGPKVLPGANQKPNYAAVGQTNQYMAGPNVRGSKTVMDPNKVSAVPGSNSRPAATIPPNGGFKTVQKQPATAPGKLIQKRASAPPKMKKSKKGPMPFFGM